MATLDIRWHLRALSSQSRWQNTRLAIARWLATAPGGFDELLLLGASAGWMMPADFLARFNRIDAVDFEWAAAPLFRLRHAQVLRQHRIALHFHRTEALGELERLVASRPGALVLFDNLLGQYTLTCPHLLTAERTLGSLQQRLQGRAWGSLHDALSGPGRHTARDQEPHAIDLPAGAPWPDDELLTRVGGHGTWRDHLTRGVLPAAVPTRLLPWQITPGYWHWLQAGWVHPPKQQEGA